MVFGRGRDLARLDCPGNDRLDLAITRLLPDRGQFRLQGRCARERGVIVGARHKAIERRRLSCPLGTGKRGSRGLVASGNGSDDIGCGCALWKAERFCDF